MTHQAKLRTIRKGRGREISRKTWRIFRWYPFTNPTDVMHRTWMPILNYPFSSHDLHLRSSNLRNPLSPPDDIYFPEYIHHENVYLCILPLDRRLVIHTYILLPHVILAGFRRTYRCPVYVRKRCFIMRAERSRHIFPSISPRYVVSLHDRRNRRILCRKKKTRRGRYLVCQPLWRIVEGKPALELRGT